MSKLTTENRGRVAEKIMDWGNFVFVGLVITQVLPGPISNPNAFIAGLFILACSYSFGIWLMKKGGGTK